MAYQTGTALGTGDLLVKLFAFAFTNGWTLDDDIVSASKSPPYCAMSKNNIFVSFSFFTSVIKIFPARGYTSGNDPADHPNSYYGGRADIATGGMRVTDIEGPYDEYHFFEDDNYIHVVIGSSNGWSHFGFGESVKFGDWKHGEYFYGHTRGTGNTISWPFASPQGNNTHQSDAFFATKNDDTSLDGAKALSAGWFNNTVYSLTDGDGAPISYMKYISGSTDGIMKPLFDVSPSSFNGYNPLFPLQFGIWDKSTSPNNFYFMGSIPNIKLINIGYQMGAEEYTIGSDTWITFPLNEGGAGEGTYASITGTKGLAYKKVTT